MKLLAILFCSLLTAYCSLVSPAWAAIAIDGTPTPCEASVADAGSPDFTCQHTTGSGSNRFIIFLATIDISTRSFTSCAYNGDAMTLFEENSHTGGGSRNQIWVLANPDSGTNNLTCEFSSVTATGVTGTIVTYTGVDQTTPIQDSAETEFSAANSSSINITCAAGDLAIDVIGSTGIADFTADGENSELLEVDRSSHSQSTSTAAGDGTSAMSWSFANETGVHTGGCINAAAAAGGSAKRKASVL
jgi:hypothetical protein